MKNNYVLFSLLAFMLIISLSCNKSNHTITAKIEGLGNDTIFIEYMTFSQRLERQNVPNRDTIIANNGSFVYDFTENENIMVFFEPAKLMKFRENGRKFQSETRSLYLILQPGDKLNIKGNIEDNYINYSVTGSNYNKAQAEHRLLNKKNDIESDSIEMLIDYYTSSKQAPPYSDSIVDKLFEKRSDLSNMIRANKLSYIKSNTNADLAAYYLTRQPLDTFGVYYDKLDESVRNGMFKGLLAESEKSLNEYKLKIVNEAKIKPGVDAPDFTLKNLEGNDVSLSDLKGKYIVLDFWGSWCGWCVKGYPRMKEYYNKYQGKLEYVGIACRDKDDDWRKAVNDNELNWVQLFNPKTDDLSKDVSILYAIKGYPSKVLLDNNLKIVEVFIGESDDFYNKLDEILKK